MSQSHVSARRYFFATASFVSTSWSGNELVRVPSSVVHAKEMGTTQTLCGQSAASWAKLWEQPFTTSRGQRCRECALAAAGSRVSAKVGSS